MDDDRLRDRGLPRVRDVECFVVAWAKLAIRDFEQRRRLSGLRHGFDAREVLLALYQPPSLSVDRQVLDLPRCFDVLSCNADGLVLALEGSCHFARLTDSGCLLSARRIRARSQCSTGQISGSLPWQLVHHWSQGVKLTGAPQMRRTISLALASIREI